MALDIDPGLVISFAAILLSGVVIYMFLKATGGFQQTSKELDRREPSNIETTQANLSSRGSRKNIPDYNTVTKSNQVEKAKSTIRTMTLKQEILSMVMKRLFEAEDEGEISREEREQLAKGYEGEMKQIEENLNQAELIVSLNELEKIRTNIISQFEATLTDTQQKIDLIIKELKIEPLKSPEEEPKLEHKPVVTKRRRPKPIKDAEGEDQTEERDEDEERSRRESVEDRLDKLKEDVLKELEELDRLELEA